MPPPAPAFPLEVFPAWLGDMVTSVARFTQTDPTMAASVALVVLSACVGGRIEVEARPGWREPTNLFLGTIAEPGERKSPVYGALTRPLYTAEKVLAAQVAPLIGEHAALREIADRAAEKAKADAAKADNLDQAARMKLGQNPGGINATQGVNFRSCHRLPIRDERQSLERGSGKPCLSLQTEKRPHLVGEPRRRGELNGSVVPDDDPTARVVIDGR